MNTHSPDDAIGHRLRPRGVRRHAMTVADRCAARFSGTPAASWDDAPMPQADRSRESHACSRGEISDRFGTGNAELLCEHLQARMQFQRGDSRLQPLL
jgi:hypothetical protein